MSYLLRIMSAGLLFCCSMLAMAQATSFNVGTDYTVLPESAARQPTAAALLQQDAGKIQVLEFFNYYCPGCFHVEPAFELWRKQAGTNVSVHRVPVAFHPQWEMVAKAYYTANELGLLETLHADLFQAIQQQGKKFATQGELADFFAKEGVDPVKFNAAYQGFNVNRYFEQAKLLKNDYAIRLVPAIVVNGKYYTDLSMAHSPDRMMEIVNYLIELSSSAP